MTDTTLLRDLEREGWALRNGYEVIDRYRGCNTAPAIVTEPGVLYGEPHIAGSRVSAMQIAVQWWNRFEDGGIADLAALYVLQSADIIVACWWAGTYGTRTWKRRYGAWAVAVHPQIWRGDYTVEAPPQCERPAPGQGGEA